MKSSAANVGVAQLAYLRQLMVSSASEQKLDTAPEFTGELQHESEIVLKVLQLLMDEMESGAYDLHFFQQDRGWRC